MFAAGIFANESGQRLVIILLKLGDIGFRGLYEKCSNQLKGDYYQTGLKRVPMWSDSVLQDDINDVYRVCPDMQETYEVCFGQYIESRFRSSKSPSHTCPTMVSFVRHYMAALGQHESLITGEYFSSKDPVICRIACMESTRNALYEMVSSANIKVEPASEVASTTPSTKVIVVDTSTPSTTPPPVVECAQLSADLQSDPEDIQEIMPDDSISQVGMRKERAENRQPSVTDLNSDGDVSSQVNQERNRVNAFRASHSSTVTQPRPQRAESNVSETSTCVSRHEFVLPRGHSTPSSSGLKQEYTPRVALPPARSTTSSAYRQVASSRDSSVSIGMKRSMSPK
jgi:hypothetical protein